MCVILNCHKKPHWSELRDCNDANPQGIGIIWWQDDLVHWKKGMDFPEFIAFFNKLNHKRTIIHFRLVSSGKECPELCHPFPMGGGLELEGSTSGKLLVHNGHLLDAQTALALSGLDMDGPVSDTRVVAAILGKKPDVCKNLPGVWIVATPDWVYTYGKMEKIRKGIWASNRHWKAMSFYSWKDWQGTPSKHGKSVARGWQADQYKSLYDAWEEELGIRHAARAARADAEIANNYRPLLPIAERKVAEQASGFVPTTRTLACEIGE